MDEKGDRLTAAMEGQIDAYLDGKWGALFRLMDESRRESKAGHDRLRDETDRINERLDGFSKRIDEAIKVAVAGREGILEAVDKKLEKHVTKDEFGPVQKGFYGMVLTVFLGFTTALWKLIGAK